MTNTTGTFAALAAAVKALDEYDVEFMAVLKGMDFMKANAMHTSGERHSLLKQINLRARAHIAAGDAGKELALCKETFLNAKANWLGCEGGLRAQLAAVAAERDAAVKRAEELEGVLEALGDWVEKRQFVKVSFKDCITPSDVAIKALEALEDSAQALSAAFNAARKGEA